MNRATPMSLSSRALHPTLLVTLVLLALPLGVDKFQVQLATKILIMAIFAMSLDLELGYCGLVSLGHAAFFGLAGYTLALLSPPYEAANFWLTLAASVGAAAAFALVIGLLVLRTSGIFFIMSTLAFAQMLYFLFHDTKIAGGSDGIYVQVRPEALLFGWRPFDLENFVHLYYVVLAAAGLSAWLLHRIVGSLFGRVIVGIRTNEHRMRSFGYATFRYKLVCFVISGALCGLAGYLSAVQFGVVNPDMLGWHLSGTALVMVILGGMGTLVGAAIGAATMVLLELALQSMPELGGIELAKHWQFLLGGFIVAVALVLPHGLFGLFQRRSAPAREVRDER